MDCTSGLIDTMFSDAELKALGTAITALTIALFGMFAAFCTYQLNRWRKYDIR